MFLLSIDVGVIEVVATVGDTHLGGEAFDNHVIDYLWRQYKKKTVINISKNFKALGKLKREVKRAPSSQHSTRPEIENVEEGSYFSGLLTCAKFKELSMDLFRNMKPVEQVLKDSNLRKEDIDEVVLVSGSARIPEVHQLLEEFFDKEASKDIHPDEAIAYGTTAQAGEEVWLILFNVSSLTLDIKTIKTTDALSKPTLPSPTLTSLTTRTLVQGPLLIIV